MYYLVNTMLYIELIGLVSTEMCWLVDMIGDGKKRRRTRTGLSKWHGEFLPDPFWFVDG